MSILSDIRELAKSNRKTVVLPEGDDVRIVEAASECASQGVADIVLLGKGEKVTGLAKERGIDLSGVKLIDPFDSSMTEDVAAKFFELRKHKGITEAEAKTAVLGNFVFYGAVMARLNLADGFVAGASHATSDVARAAIYCLEIDREIGTVSGSFLMEVPDCVYGERGIFVFADSGIIPDPSARQMVGIAKASAELFRQLVRKEPKVAMLSYSTKGSAEGPMIDKVREAVAKFKSKFPDITIDGELQADSALVPDAAQKKSPDSPVGGQANVLIFPNLDSGNISYKLTQRLAKARAVGPLIQGMTKPCSDLSRGCSVDDVVDAVAITAVRAQ